MRPPQPHVLPVAAIRRVPRGVIGGLVLEEAEPARAAAYDERWERDTAIRVAVHHGLLAAAAGRRPAREVDRLPPWLLSVITRRLRDHETHWLGEDFVVARTLELVGLAELEPDDDYVLSMLTGLVAAWSWDHHVWGDPVAWFRHDPELIERCYWRAYEIEGQGVISLRFNDGGPRGTDWRRATATMIDEGMITRARVITAGTEALDRDFASAASRWFVALLQDLELTDAELAERQPALRRQLNHRAAPVVTNAVAWLKRLDRAALLDDEATAPALETAVAAPTKATALVGLKILGSIRTRTPSAEITAAARAGLSHRHPDVQRAAARLLISAGADDQLAADAEVLDPSVRSEFGLLGPPDLRTPDLITGLAVEPVVRPVTEHDVVERLAALLERVDDPVELELVLDRLAQLGPSELLRPLVKRARTIVAPERPHGVEREMAALVLASTGAPVSRPEPTPHWARFLRRRLDEVNQVREGSAAPSALLATPTDPGGWVDPLIFVERARGADLHGRRADVIAGLLRLGPDHRPEALQAWAAAAVAPRWEQLVRYALGDELEPDLTPDDRALWVAASRARAPLDDDARLIAAGLGGAGQGRALDPTVALVENPPRPAHEFGEAGWHPMQGSEDRHTLHVTYSHSCTPGSFSASRRNSWWTRNRRWTLEQPTATGDFSSDRGWDSFAADVSWEHWHAVVWPADAEHHAAVVIVPVLMAAQWSDSYPTTRVALAALRRHPGRMGPTAAATIALACTDALAENRIHAADTIVDLIGRERITVAQLAAAMTTVAPEAVLTRWADTLGQVAAAGRPLVTIELLTQLLPDLPRDRHGLHALVDLLHQELLRSGGAVSDLRLRDHLARFTGSSKVARSARALLAL